jgi:hypothetical protein
MLGPADGGINEPDHRLGQGSMRAVVLAGQLMVVRDKPICLVNLPSAQLTGIVSGQDITRRATGDQGPQLN